MLIRYLSGFVLYNPLKCLLAFEYIESIHLFFCLEIVAKMLETKIITASFLP